MEENLIVSIICTCILFLRKRERKEFVRKLVRLRNMFIFFILSICFLVFSVFDGCLVDRKGFKIKF